MGALSQPLGGNTRLAALSPAAASCCWHRLSAPSLRPPGSDMNQWPGGAPNGTMFPQSASGPVNPAAMYNNPSFDMNSQFAQGFANNSTNATPNPGFPTQAFQPPPSVVPAKRGFDGSPQQPQPSRSQTPNFTFPGQQQPAGQQFPNAPTPYQHLQQPATSNHATPSPTMQNQAFRPPPQPQPQPQPRMPNASPSPFPPQHHQQAGSFGGSMPPGTPQQAGAHASMPQPGQAWNQGMGMTPNSMSMPGMQSSMPGAMNPQNVQRQYQMKLMQQQEMMRRNGMAPPRNMGAQPGGVGGFSGQQGGAPPASNGQLANAQTMAANQQKRRNFLTTLQAQVQGQGKPFDPAPKVGGKPVDLYMLWSIVASVGGSQNVERQGQWQAVANKLGFMQPQFMTAPDELKQLFLNYVTEYERRWWQVKAQQKQEQARNYAHQMAGYGGPSQNSPTKMMPPQPQTQPNQMTQLQQNQPLSQQPNATPVQAHTPMMQNGMATPQQMMNHRRNSSIKKPDQMTPQAANQSLTAPSPQSGPKVQRSPSLKRESPVAVMKSEEPQSTNYEPNTRTIESDGGYDVSALHELGNMIARAKPNMPTIDEMGVIDMRAITRSLESGIHGEVRYALDALTIISRDERIHFELEKCEDLIDVIVDCAEDQVERLSEAAEVSDALDLASYEDVMRGARVETETLQDVPAFGTREYEIDRSADRLIAITTILRNFSFFEHNHPLLTSAPLLKWLSNAIRLLGTRNMLLRTFYNTLDFYKDMITFLSNVTQSLELPGRDDALHVLHFLLAFAPQPAPSYAESGGNVRFASFVPAVHRFLPPAVDCLAKLLARQDPNRMLYRSIFTAPSSSLAASESPLDLLTRAFALSISVLPDRSKGTLYNNTQLRIVEARKSYLCQGMLAADILASLAPSTNTELARSWIESEDGWAVGLLNLSALLSIDRSQPSGPGKGQLGHDTETFKLITHRALSMFKRLAEKAGKGAGSRAVPNGVMNGDLHAEEDNVGPKWEGIPQGHSILGALMMPNTDKAALGLLCHLHEMVMQ
ncbi:hypothetical protein KC361_g1889 [Hortaea werneckii]|nr:hypothetical protein KC361_g1889 [Hortaea werneckii]